MTITATIEITSNNPYHVFIGNSLEASVAEHAARLKPQQLAIITQPAVMQHAQAIAAHARTHGITATIIEVPDAEAAKTLDVAATCWDQLGERAFGRRDVICGVGGGAVTDLAGFIAATWMRGVSVIHVPTTLLAMVDAAVGGKTGINTAAGKNLVGAFHEPAAVFADVDLLKTLPPAEIVAGSAEIIKAGFISDPQILDLYEHDPAACLDVDGNLPELIRRAVAVKAAVVGVDLKESGLRETLNYGHTFGHAVELYENYQWRHGTAVAVGMMFIAHLSHARGLITTQLRDRHRGILSSIGLPTTYRGPDFSQLYPAMTRDKKNRDGKIRFVALTNVGQCTRLDDASYAELEAAYDQLSS